MSRSLPQSASGELKGKLALGVAMIGTAFSSVLNKFALGEGMHPMWINAQRLGFSLLLMVAYALITRQPLYVRMPRREFRLSLLSGLLLAAHFTCWVYALKYTDALAAATIWSTYLFFTALGAMLLFKERVPAAGFLAMALAFAGVLVCNMGWTKTSTLGNLFALGASLTQAGYFMCGRFVRRKVDNFSYTLVLYAASFVATLLTALAARLPLQGFSTATVGAALGLAILCNLMGHSLANYALKSLSAATVSIGMLAEVITGPLLVFLIMHEAPGCYTLLGGAMILIAVAWYFWMDWNRKTLRTEETAADRA
jgi:drug/metabolite transporter (DMT)-like permease